MKTNDQPAKMAGYHLVLAFTCCDLRFICHTVTPYHKKIEVDRVAYHIWSQKNGDRTCDSKKENCHNCHAFLTKNDQPTINIKSHDRMTDSIRSYEAVTV
jgi:hypothetical protein